MKKLVLGFVTIATVMGAKAQTKDAWHVHYGLQAGINVSTLSAKESGTTQTIGSQVGFNGGAFVELPVCSSFSVQPEVNYSQMGTKADAEKLHFNYLNVPVLAKYKSGNLAVYAGPQVGFLLSAKEKTSSTTTDEKSNIKSTDFAGVFGTEYDFHCGFSLCARYQLGLMAIQKSSGTFSSEDIKNHGFTFTVGYRIK